MQEKAKRKPQQEMSRRQFLQVGIATGAIATGAGILALWGNTSSQAVRYSYSWVRPDVLRLNQDSSDLLGETLSVDGFAPAEVKVYDRAMEYKTAYSAKSEVVSREVLFREDETAEIAFSIDADVLNDEMQATLIQDISDSLSRNNSFRMQNINISFLSQ